MVGVYLLLYVTYFSGMYTPSVASYNLRKSLYVTYFSGMYTPLYT